MKRIIKLVLSLICIFGLVGCGDNSISEVKIDYGNSALYSEEDMNAAILLIKDTFSAWSNEEYRKALEGSGRKTVILMGIETHICVEQTALDLMEEGYTVFVPADCVQSRNPVNREISLRRMEEAGAVITCSESILYELMGSSKAAEFKAISAIIK